MQIHTLNVSGMHRKRRKLCRDASFIKGNLLEVGETLSALTRIPLEVFHRIIKTFYTTHEGHRLHVWLRKSDNERKFI